jgi:acetyl esterase
MTPDPHMLAILERLRAAPAVDYARIQIAEARAIFDQASAAWREPALPVSHVEDLAIPTPAGSMRARLYRPAEGPLPLVIYVHGGGWTFGSVDTHDVEMRHLAHFSGAAVLGFDYRLAPKHPFPAGLDDVLEAIAFAETGGLGESVDPQVIALAGDSAGANLALAALIARRETGKRMPITAALFYGCYAPDFSTESHARLGDGSYLLSTERMHWYWRNFLGQRDEAEPGSLAVPLDADLSGLPPLYLNAAGLDPLLDDTLNLCRRLAAAGADFRFDFVPGVVHGFLRMARDLPAARGALAAAGAYLAERLNTSPLGGNDDETQDIS